MSAVLVDQLPIGEERIMQWLAATCLLLVGLWPLTTTAGDGLLEINQACAQGPGCFGEDMPGFPVEIVRTGSYLLTGNLHVPNADTTAISIDARNVTVDLGGFEISGVTNCTGSPPVCTPVSGTGIGILVIDPNSNNGAHVHNGWIRGMGFAGASLGHGAVVEHVRASSNRNFGIRAGSGCFVANTIVSMNGGIGIFCGAHCVAIGNSAFNNGVGGLNFGVSALIRSNVARSNGGDGMHAGGSSSLIDNVSTSSGDHLTHDGIDCEVGCNARGNTLQLNAGYGLRQAEPQSAYRENVITSNLTGTVLGGNNRGDNFCQGPGTISEFCP